MHRVDKELREGDTIVFLGDYVDRGKQSFEVLALLHILKLLEESEDAPDVEIVILLGNHDYYFLDFIDKRGIDVYDIEWVQRYMTETLYSFCKHRDDLMEFVEHVPYLNLQAIQEDLHYKMWYASA